MLTNKRGCKNIGALTLVAALTVMLASVETNAQNTQKPDLGASLRFNQAYVDNATGTRENEEHISERQSEYTLSVEALWDSEWVNLAADYEASQTRFDKDTQSEDDVLEGASDIRIGKANSFFELSAGHSSRQFIVDPEVSTILRSNLQERQIFWYSPALRSRLGSANEVSVAYKFVDIAFEDNEQNDSEREGAEFTFSRRLSALHSLDFSYKLEDIRFKLAEDSDSELETYQLRFFGASRIIEYHFALGTSQVKPSIGERFNRPLVDIALDSRLAGLDFRAFYSRQISDTSQGNANDGFFSGDLNFEGANNQGVDQVERTSAGLSWQMGFPCQRCTTSLSIGVEEDEFVNLTENDSSEEFAEFQFRYQISRRWSLLGSLRESTIDSGNLRPEIDNTRVRAGISGQLGKYLALGVEVSESTQRFETSEDISIGRIEASISYLFE